jgi:hypothetical protein
MTRECITISKSSPPGFQSWYDLRGAAYSGCSHTCGGGKAPPETPAKTDGDALLAQELNQLSLEERERVYEEIHGVAEAVEETEDFVKEKLEQIQEEIMKIRKRAAYDKAFFMSPERVKDRAFRLMFLRAECFHARKAAKRLVLFFHHKLEFFGLERLVNKITLDDLDDDDKTALIAGSFQVLPDKDRAGRTIICNLHGCHNFKSWVNQVSRSHLLYGVDVTC